MAKSMKDDAQGKGKKDKDEDRSGAIGDNLTQDTFLQSVQEMAAANAAVKAANEVRKKVRKTCKARGIELGDLDAIVRMADWDREEVHAQFVRRQRYAQWLGLPGVQAELFEGDETAKASAKWEARGKTDALAGKGPQIPEECPEPYALNWKRGYKIAKGEAPPEIPAKAKKGKGEKTLSAEEIQAQKDADAAAFDADEKAKKAARKAEDENKALE